MSIMKNHKRGRPVEYTGGTEQLTATVPKELLKEFKARIKDLGNSNLSKMVTDALRLWMSSRSVLGSASTAVLVELPLNIRQTLALEASSTGVSLGNLLRMIALDHVKAGTQKLLKDVRKAL
jgi:hypothetical protein